jgi:hypothetical protein
VSRRRARLCENQPYALSCRGSGGSCRAPVHSFATPEHWADLRVAEAKSKGKVITMNDRVKIPRNEPCPCGSGAKYKRCCVDKGFTWVRDAEGKILREVPISDEMRELFLEQRQRFIERHGRPPGPDDPVFDEHTEHVERRIVETMKAAGIRPALIYAFEKSGVLVTEDNQHMIPTADLENFTKAYHEWHEIHGEPVD